MVNDTLREFEDAVSQAQTTVARAVRSNDEDLARQAVRDVATRVTACYTEDVRPEPTKYEGELRDCPMCLTGRPVIGTTVKNYGRGPRRVWSVACWRCLTSTRFYNKRQDAVDIWNGKPI